MPARHLAQIIISGMRIVGRAFARAVQDEYAASQQAARSRRSQTSETAAGSDPDAANKVDAQFYGLTLGEAKQILNLEDISDRELLEKRYQHLFSINDKGKGGSLYLQSKVFRAKERIDFELQEIHMKAKKEKEET